MIKIVGPNDSGKTLELIKKAYEANSWIVCRDPNRIQDVAAINGYLGIHAMSYMEFLQNKTIMGHYFIDDVDKLLTFMGCSGFTLTIDK